MFNVVETTIQQYHIALLDHHTTCEEVVTSYLERVASLDKDLRSIVHLNPQSISQAQELDRRLAHYTDQDLPPLFGVPIVLKDTYGTTDLPTTVGSKSLVGLQTEDAVVVRRLREAGAILLGKTNCSEFCVSGCTLSSIGGQTLNPYDLTRTPGGSSGGTGVAIAANLAMVGCGGDTVNSIRSPASACNIIGLRPSAGRIPLTGVFPCAWSQDSVGPMGRTIQDVSVLFDVMQGDSWSGIRNATYSREAVSRKFSKEKPKLGILEYFCPEPGDNEDADTVSKVFKNALEKLDNIVEYARISTDELGAQDINFDLLCKTVDVQRFEFATAVDEYLKSKNVKYSPHKSLKSIVDKLDHDRRGIGSVFFQAIEPGQNTNNPDYQVHLTRMQNLYEKLEACLERHHLDAFIFPHQQCLVVKVGTSQQSHRNGILASLTGCPSLCFPAGFSSTTKDAVLGVPVGMEIVGRRGDDHLLLDIGSILTRVLDYRRPPVLEL